MRSVMRSTVPAASPRSTTSPMPNWSSISMNSPARQSLTTFWAPNPRATPAIPAPAISGARSMPSSPRTRNRAITQMSTVTVEAITVEIEVARADRRGISTASSSAASLALSEPSDAPIFISARVADWRSVTTSRYTPRRIARRATRETIQATTRIRRISSGLPMNQSAVVASAPLSVRSHTHRHTVLGSLAARLDQCRVGRVDGRGGRHRRNGSDVPGPSDRRKRGTAISHRCRFWRHVAHRHRRDGLRRADDRRLLRPPRSRGDLRRRRCGQGRPADARARSRSSSTASTASSRKACARGGCASSSVRPTP